MREDVALQGGQRHHLVQVGLDLDQPGDPAESEVAQPQISSVSSARR